MLAVFSAEPGAQDSVMNSQDTDRLIILTECRHVTEVRHESSLCVFYGDVIGFHAAEKTRSEIKIHISTPPATLAPQHFSFLTLQAAQSGVTRVECKISLLYT